MYNITQYFAGYNVLATSSQNLPQAISNARDKAARTKQNDLKLCVLQSFSFVVHCLSFVKEEDQPAMVRLTFGGTQSDARVLQLMTITFSKIASKRV